MCSSSSNWAHSSFKKALNASKVNIPSQVIVKETALAEDDAYYLNLLRQIWAKRQLPIWKIVMENPSKEKGVVIISYAVRKIGQNQAITSASISIDDDYKYFIYHSEKHECNEYYMSNVIPGLLKSLLKHMKNERTIKVENFVIYRDGLNEPMLTMVRKYEVEPILETIYSEFNESKICFILVNQRTSTRLFELQSPNLNKGFELYNFNKNDQGLISNPPIGLLVINKITLENIWDFYICSAHSSLGTNIPTHYIVGYNNTSLSSDFVYELTYNLTFLYYNTNKCVRVPGPLLNVINRNKRIETHNYDYFPLKKGMKNNNFL